MDPLPLEALPLPTVVIDGTCIAQANPPFAALLGLSGVGVAIGQPYLDFVAPEDRPRIADRQRRRLAGEAVPPAYEATLLGADGPVPVQIRVTVHGNRWIAQLLDLRGEASRRELLSSLARLGAEVQRELSDAAVQRRVREGLLELGIWSVWGVRDGADLRLAWVEMGPGPERAALESMLGAPLDGFRAPPTPFPQRVWSAGAAFTDDWPLEAERWLRAPVAAALRELPPRGASGSGIGLRVDVAGAEPALLFAVGGWLRSDDLPAFRLFASQVAAALDAARAVATLRARNEDLAALNRLADAATSAPDFESFLARAEEIVRGATGCDGFGVLLVDEERGHARLVRASRLAPEIERHDRRVPLDDPAIAALLREQRVLLRHPAEFGDHPFAEAMRRAGIGTAVGVPLRFRTGTVGLLTVDFAGPPRDAASCRADLLQAMASHVAAAVENHRLLADLRRRVSAVEAVNALVLRVFTTPSGEAHILLEAACRQIAGALEAQAVVVLRAAEDGRRLVGVAGFGTTRPAAELSLELARSPAAAEALRRGEPVWAPEAHLGPGVEIAAEEDGPRLSFLLVPLTSRQARRGLVAIGAAPPRRFDEAGVALAAALASAAAMGLENAELYAAERRRVEELSRLNEENARLFQDLRASYAELARAQEQLIRQERLAALGQLAAVIAHEVRNPLGVIFNSFATLRRLVKPDGDARMLFDIVGEEAERLNRMVGDLLDFARPATPQLRPEPLDRVVDHAIAGALAGAPPGLRVERELPAALPLVPMDARLMRQALLNVLLNAVQAMPGGGTLAVCARQEGGAVRLEVADTGTGIPEEVRHRVFEPFFTTRPTGTGLGLAVVKRIAEDHRAPVGIESVEGGGTRFVLLLPLEAHGAADPGPDRAGGTP